MVAGWTTHKAWTEIHIHSPVTTSFGLVCWFYVWVFLLCFPWAVSSERGLVPNFIPCYTRAVHKVLLFNRCVLCLACLNIKQIAHGIAGIKLEGKARTTTIMTSMKSPCDVVRSSCHVCEYSALTATDDMDTTSAVRIELVRTLGVGRLISIEQGSCQRFLITWALLTNHAVNTS